MIFSAADKQKFTGDRKRLARMSLVEGIVPTWKISSESNGITPRRWLEQCNPGLSRLITIILGIEKSMWLKDLIKLEGLLDYVEDEDFREDWAAVKQANKEGLAYHMQVT